MKMQKGSQTDKNICYIKEISKYTEVQCYKANRQAETEEYRHKKYRKMETLTQVIQTHRYENVCMYTKVYTFTELHA